jgi:excisionase family DNA binding protein
VSISDLDKKLLSVDDLSAKIGVAKNTIYDWVSMGKLPHLKLGKLVKFEADKIERWLQTKRVETTDFS